MKYFCVTLLPCLNYFKEILLPVNAIVKALRVFNLNMHYEKIKP